MINEMIKLTMVMVVAVVAFFAVIMIVRIIVKIQKDSRRRKRVSSYMSDYEELHNAARGGGGSSLAPSPHRVVRGFTTKLNIDQQNRFIPGREAYERARDRGNLRSIIFRDAAGLQKLLEEKAGTGEFVAVNKERVDFGQSLGQYMDPVAKTKAMTTVGIIHYTDNGAYIVPARPMAKEDFNG